MCEDIEVNIVQLYTQFHSSQLQLRNRDHRGRLGGAMNDHIATTYGIARKSILNTSRYYHVADGLPPDCMHDVLEGVLPYKTKMLLLTSQNDTILG